jgi:hypothetical protein
MLTYANVCVKHRRMGTLSIGNPCQQQVTSAAQGEGEGEEEEEEEEEAGCVRTRIKALLRLY